MRFERWRSFQRVDIMNIANIAVASESKIAIGAAGAVGGKRPVRGSSRGQKRRICQKLTLRSKCHVNGAGLRFTLTIADINLRVVIRFAVDPVVRKRRRKSVDHVTSRFGRRARGLAAARGSVWLLRTLSRVVLCRYVFRIYG